jgi:hypothetical protein
VGRRGGRGRDGDPSDDTSNGQLLTIRPPLAPLKRTKRRAALLLLDLHPSPLAPSSPPRFPRGGGVIGPRERPERDAQRETGQSAPRVKNGLADAPLNTSS